MKSVAFDVEKHEYDQGKLWPVTTVIREAGFMGATDFYTEEGRERGSAVHLACQYHDEGDLDMDSLDPAIQPYVSAYIRFKADNGFDPTWIECPIKDARGLYAGRPDRILTTRPRSLWDLKTGSIESWHCLQSAAYVAMLEDPFSYSRFALYLSRDGRYSVREHPKAEYIADLNVFLSALNCLNWKRSKGLI